MKKILLALLVLCNIAYGQILISVGGNIGKYEIQNDYNPEKNISGTIGTQPSFGVEFLFGGKNGLGVKYFDILDENGKRLVTNIPVYYSIKFTPFGEDSLLFIKSAFGYVIPTSVSSELKVHENNFSPLDDPYFELGLGLDLERINILAEYVWQKASFKDETGNDSIDLDCTMLSLSMEYKIGE